MEHSRREAIFVHGRDCFQAHPTEDKTRLQQFGVKMQPVFFFWFCIACGFGLTGDLLVAGWADIEN